MPGENESKKLYDRSGHRSHSIFLAYSLLAIAILVLVTGCAHEQSCLKAVVSGGESIEFNKSFVKYVNIENDDRGYSRFAAIYLTEKGDEALYKVFERNVGRYISAYYGGKQIVPETYIAEPMKAGKIIFLLENEKDEALALEIIKTYSCQKFVRPPETLTR